MSDQGRTLIRRAVEEIYNQGKLAVVDEIVSSDFVIHSGSEEIRGREAAKQRHRAVVAELVVDLVGENRHAGPFGEIDDRAPRLFASMQGGAIPFGQTLDCRSSFQV